MANHAAITTATTNPAPIADSAPWLLLWQQLLKTWATDGSLTAAALEALQLEHTPGLLNELNDAWALGDLADLPPIELLSAADISGALGAYAASTAAIYLNSDWLSSASHEQIHAVLTEELGHHLDSLLNITDTPGDEGQLFAAQLHAIPHNSEQLIAIHQENDHAVISTGDRNIAIEKSDSNSTLIIRGNSLYTIVDGPSWTGAEAKANKLGGNLASPNSAEENEYIFQAYKDTAIEYWIGINDAQNEGTWQWTSGEEVLFTNFFNGGQENPHSHGNSERDYGAIYTNHPTLGTDGTWGWASNSHSIQGIAEIPFIRHGNSAYVIVEGPTWEEAEANAVALGGHLVTINNAEENEWILDTYKDYRNTSAPNIVGERKVYIGLNDKTEEGKWEWISGESSSWSPTWASGMPDNYGNSEDVAEYYLADTQHWRLWKRGEINDVANEAITGLAEITLTPNNIPTGTPTLSGDFKSGQIVSIYPSGFIDLDNFKGWTPNYSYSWEVSGDNGSTWTSLTSPDATDGNESYILTSEELGKQIRGVVSYLDGHGTYEVVASEAKHIEMGEGYPIDPTIYRTPLTGAVSGSKENDFILAEPTNEHGYPINDALIIDTLGNNLIVSRNHYHGNQSWTSIHNSEIVLGEGNDSINTENLREASHSNGYGIIDSEIELGGGNNKVSVIIRANAHNAIKGVAGTTINGGAGNDSLHIDIKNQTVTDIRNSAGIEDAQIDLGNGENRVFIKMNEGTAEHTSSTAEGVKHSVITTGEGKDHIEVQTDYRGISNSQISLGSGDDIVKIFTETYGIDDSDLQLGPGDDYVEIRTNGEDSLSILGSQIHLGAGNDRLEIGRSRGEIYGGEGEDNLVLYDLSKEDAVVSINANGNTLISSTSDQLFAVTAIGIENLSFKDGNLSLSTSPAKEEPNKSFDPSKYALYLAGEFVSGNRVTVDTSELRNSKEYLEGKLTYAIKWERSKDEGNTWEEVSLTNQDDYHSYSLTDTDTGTFIRAKIQYVTADGITGTLLAKTKETITRYHDKVMPFDHGLKIAFDEVLTEFTREYIFTSPGTEGGSVIWGLNGEGLFEGWELGIWISQNELYERFIRPDNTSGGTDARLSFTEGETHSLVLTVGDDNGTSIYIDGIKVWSDGHTSINPGKDSGWISNETLGYFKSWNGDGVFSGDFLRYRYWHEEASPEQISTLETSLDTPVYDLAVRGGVITNGIGSGDPIVLNDSIDFTSEIIEIDSTRFIESKSSVLVRPGNYEPKGTLILNGDFKVGQTITIDESGIDDTDNFEDWTPNYEYSWEVSNDNGNTWTEVTGDDATDGDDSYTLTSAEVGKQLRGVVSYLDGYGTNEVVKSDKYDVPLFLVINPRFSSTPTEGAGTFSFKASVVPNDSDWEYWHHTPDFHEISEDLKVYWQLNGIDLDDLSKGALEGSSLIREGLIEESLELVIDDDIHESLSLKIFSDPNFEHLIGTIGHTPILESNSRVILKENWLHALQKETDMPRANGLIKSAENNESIILFHNYGYYNENSINHLSLFRETDNQGIRPILEKLDSNSAEYTDMTTASNGSIVIASNKWSGNTKAGGLTIVTPEGDIDLDVSILLGKNTSANAGVGVDDDNNVYIGGSGLGVGGASGDYRGWLQKYSAGGSLDWSITLSEGEQNAGYQYAVKDLIASTNGDIFLIGQSQNPTKTFLSKHDSEGNKDWIKEINGSVHGSTDLAIDSEGNVIVLSGKTLYIHSKDGHQIKSEQLTTDRTYSMISLSDDDDIYVLSNGEDSTLLGRLAKNSSYTELGEIDETSKAINANSFSAKETPSGIEILLSSVYFKSSGEEVSIESYQAIGDLRNNNLPTRTPTLTGDFKAGKTIYIDTSDIEDADNFEDWTTAYEYSWEVSNDNGITWSALTSSDATDGDNSYTLTSAEIGKQLRGVVSYLDGYGTYESIASMAINSSNESGRLISIDTAGISGSAGQTIAIPITINDIADVQAFDLSLQLDPTIFGQPTASPLIEPGELNDAWNLAATFSSQGLVTISGYDSQPLAAGDGTIAQLNLSIKSDAPIGDTLIDLTSAFLNEGNISSSFIDQTLSIIPPTFQILSSRSLPSGIALKLTDTPDLGAFNLYDGQDSSIDTPDLSLTDSSGNTIPLSAHWQASSKELLLLATQPLNTGAYSLQVDSRADGLISASGDLLDGNRDGTAGDAFSATIQHIASDHSISIAHTARGAGQQLSLNGTNTRDGITGLPVTLSTSSALTSLEGNLAVEGHLLTGHSIRAGDDLPADWTISLVTTADPFPNNVHFSAIGTTPITGNNLELFRFDALIHPEAAADSPTGNYSSTSLIHAAITGTSDPTLNPSSFASDPGLIVLAYSGDTTGNGTLSSLDASLVQRVVVGLDSGFDAHDHLNPLLLADTTGNGTLSSLDASRIQQQVVGHPVDSFPAIG